MYLRAVNKEQEGKEKNYKLKKEITVKGWRNQHPFLKASKELHVRQSFQKNDWCRTL